MSPKNLTPKGMKEKKLSVKNIKSVGTRRKGVQNLSDYVQAEQSAQLSTLKDQTIYIVKLEPMSSDEFGEGFKIWYKDMPNARDTLQAHTFGKVTVPVLTQLWNNSHEGKTISLDSPVRATVRVSGRTTILE